MEVGEDGIVESDIGLLGIEQDSVAIKGYQFDQMVNPITYTRRHRGARRCYRHSRKPPNYFFKSAFYQIHFNYQWSGIKKGQVPGSEPEAGNRMARPLLTSSPHVTVTRAPGGFYP